MDGAATAAWIQLRTALVDSPIDICCTMSACLPEATSGRAGRPRPPGHYCLQVPPGPLAASLRTTSTEQNAPRKTCCSTEVSPWLPGEPLRTMSEAVRAAP